MAVVPSQTEAVIFSIGKRNLELFCFPSQPVFVSRRQLHRQRLSQREGPEGAAQLCGRCQVRRERGLLGQSEPVYRHLLSCVSAVVITVPFIAQLNYP